MNTATALQAKRPDRVFSYAGAELPDPNPAMTPDGVRQLYSASYPELNNATIEGPVVKHAKMIYTFARTAGSKG